MITYLHHINARAPRVDRVSAQPQAAPDVHGRWTEYSTVSVQLRIGPTRFYITQYNAMRLHSPQRISRTIISSTALGKVRCVNATLAGGVAPLGAVVHDSHPSM